MNFSRLFCITFSNSLNLLTRASLSSDILPSDPGFGSWEETSPVASFVCWCSDSLSETCWLPAVSCVSTSPCSIFCLHFTNPAKFTKSTVSRRGQPPQIWRVRSDVRLATTLNPAVTPPQSRARQSSQPEWL